MNISLLLISKSPQSMAISQVHIFGVCTNPALCGRENETARPRYLTDARQALKILECSGNLPAKAFQQLLRERYQVLRLRRRQTDRPGRKQQARAGSINICQQGLANLTRPPRTSPPFCGESFILVLSPVFPASPNDVLHLNLRHLRKRIWIWSNPKEFLGDLVYL